MIPFSRVSNADKNLIEFLLPLLEQQRANALREGATPASCKALATVPLSTGSSDFFYGWSSRNIKIHAEEMIIHKIIAKYYAASLVDGMTLRIPVTRFYVDLAPCDGRYAGHRCANFFANNGRNFEYAGKTVAVEFVPGGGVGVGRYLFECPPKGERADLYELNGGELKWEAVLLGMAGSSIPEAHGIPLFKLGGNKH